MEIISSGTITAYKNNPIEILIEEEINDGSINFIFNFVNDGEDPRMESDVTNIDGDVEIEFSLFNHDTNRIGPEDPIKIGRFDGREISLMYYVSTKEGDPNKVRMFSYTVYLKEGNDGTE